MLLPVGSRVGMGSMPWGRVLCTAALVLLLGVGPRFALAAEETLPVIGSPVLTGGGAAEKVTASTSHEPGELVVFNRSVITFRVALLGVSPADRARRTHANLDRLLDRAGLGKLEVRSESLGSFVMLDGALALIVTAGDADALEGETLEQATQGAVERLRQVIDETRESRDVSSLLRGALKAAGATGVFIVGLLLFARGRRAFGAALANAVHRRADRLRLAGAELLRRDQLAAGIRVGTLALHWLLALALTYEWMSFSLSVF
ncbi:MAG: hypothetical protein B7Y51_12885, partial [Burkholderiales bacterium 28-67-8]